MPFLDSSRHLIRVWLASVRASAVREMEYRFNFYLSLIRQVLWLGAFVMFINVIFSRTQSLSGWSQSQVLILLALSRLIEGLMNSVFIYNLMIFPEMIKNGFFDMYLLRPLPAQYFTAFRLFDLSELGNVFGGLALLIYALTHGAAAVSPLSWLMFFVLALCGIISYYSILIMVASLAFVLESLESFWGINAVLSEPFTIPFDVLPRGARLALTYLLPLGLVVFVPAQTLTGKLSWLTAVAAVFISVVFLLLANLVWRAGLRRYSSAG